jgi:Ca-activated chloride channel family protein
MSLIRRVPVAGIITALLLAAGCLAFDSWSLLRPDQRGHRMFSNQQFAEAANTFADPMWKGVALFKAGEFKAAAAVFAGINTAEAAYNHGNCLVMTGNYIEAVERYDSAIERVPGYGDAMVNRQIALSRAEMLQPKGGEMTGGMLAADEFVFSEASPSPSSGEDTVEEQVEATGAELQAIWLRQVQTKPADFLRAKFAYQHAMGNRREDGQ